MPYHAFISYSHAADARLAAALQAALLRFARPWWVRRALRLFRDKTSLALTPALWPTLEEALAESEYLILLASPASAASHWVQREVDWWLTHRSVDRLLIVVTDGQMRWDAAKGGFAYDGPPLLPPRADGGFSVEPLWLDLSWATAEHDLAVTNPRFLDAVASLAGPLHGRPKDDLIGDDVREHRRNRRYAWTAVCSLVVLLGLAIAFGVLAEQRRREAERQRLEAERQTRIALEQTEIAQRQTGIANTQTEVARREARIAVARGLVAQADVLRTPLAGDRQVSALLAVEALQRGRALGMAAFEADRAVRRAFELLPQPLVAWTMDGPADAVAFSDDGRRVVAATRRLGLAAWDLRSRVKVLRRTSSLQADVVALPQGGRFLAVGRSGQHATTAYVLDVASGERVGDEVSLGDDGEMRAVAVSSNGTYLATVGRNTPEGPLVVRDVATGTEVGRTQITDSIAFAQAGRYLGGGGLWQVSTTGGVRALRQTRVPLKTAFETEAVGFSPDGRYFARALSSVETPRVIELWSTRDETLVAEVEYVVPGDALAVSEGGRYVAVTSRGSTSPLGHIIELRDMTTGHAVTLQLGDAPRSLAFGPDDMLAVGDAGGRVTVWSIASLADVARFDPPGDVKGASFSDDGARLTTVSWIRTNDGGVRLAKRVFDVGRRQEVSDARQDFALDRHAFSADGTRLAVAATGEVAVWQVATKRLHRRVRFDGLVSRQIALDADGRHLAVLTANRFQVWDLDTSRVVATVASGPRGSEFIFEGANPTIALGRDRWIVATAFRRPTGRRPSDRLATYLRVWDVKAGTELMTVPLSEPVFGKEPTHAALSDDGRYLAISVDDDTLDLYDLHSTPTAPVRIAHKLIGFSSDSRYLVASDTASDASPFTVYVTPNGLRSMGTGRRGGVAHVYDVATRQELVRIEHEPGSRPIALSHSGAYLAVLGQNGQVRVATVDTTRLAADACRRLARNLTMDEWRRYVGTEPYAKTCSALP